MAKLEGQTIAASYDQLLHVDTEGGGNSTTHVSVKDGDNDTTFGFTIASDALMMSSTNRLEFGDTGTYINQSGDGILNITSDTEVEINATEVDLNGTLDVSGTLTQGGASQFNSTITVGVDNTGYDVKLFGATSGAYALWDESADNLILAGGAGIVEEGGVLKENLITNSGFDVWSNSTLETVATTHSESFESNAGLWTGNFNTSEATSTDEANSGSNSLKCTNTGGGWGLTYQSSAITVVIGKLYKVSVYAHNGNSGSTRVTAGSASATGTDIFESGTVTTGGWSEHTFVFEATTTALWIVLGTYDGAAPYNLYNYYDDITVTEVTPGCVANDNKGPDGWYTEWAGVNYPDVYRHHDVSDEDDANRNTKDGSFYSLKFTATESLSQHHNVAWPKGFNDNEEWRNRVRGRTLTFGCWSKSANVGDAQMGIKYHDGVWQFISDTNTGTTWEWLEVTKTIPTDADQIQVYMQNDTSGETTYFSQPMLVFGSSIGEGNYTRPQGEIVWFENHNVTSNKFNDKTGANGFSDVAVTSYNLEADSNGVIPKGAKAIMPYVVCRDSASASTNYTRITFGVDSVYATQSVSCAGLANDIYTIGQTWADCKSDGDIYYHINASGSNTFDIESFKYLAVQLR